MVWAEDSFVKVFEREVESLSWEITDDVGKVTSPEGSETLFSVHTDKAVTDTIIPLISWDIFDVVLHLEEKLNSLNWSNHGL